MRVAASRAGHPLHAVARACLENAQHSPTLRQLCLERQLRGNEVPDAWLAASVAHLGEHLVSFDRDFRKLLSRGQFTLLVPV